MDISSFAQILIEKFPYKPTADQIELLNRIAEFAFQRDENSMFIIKGYAGTGKTTVVSNLVKTLPLINAKTVLLAPTGRAAKVMAAYSGTKAFTIHKKIYRINATKEGVSGLRLIENKHKNTFFLVDEASMISASSNMNNKELFAGRNLLDDLVDYVYGGENCRLVLIGDTAQLPPVKSLESPALNPEFMSSSYHCRVFVAVLKEVVRQAQDSGVLYNATILRILIANESPGFPKLDIEGFPDVKRLAGSHIIDAITGAFSYRNCEDAVIIC
ncbi:MAG: AAA family ATPase, partial [Bacteroidales bacterium]